MDKKTEFGTKEAIKSPTPLWAKWVFRTALYLNAGFAVYLAATKRISPELKDELQLILTAFVLPGIHLLSKCIGIKDDDANN